MNSAGPRILKGFAASRYGFAAAFGWCTMLALHAPPANATQPHMAPPVPAQASIPLHQRMMQRLPSNVVPVLTVTQETIEHREKAEMCWRVIVTDRERARAQYEAQPWVVKYWQPILGGVLGGAVGYHFTRNYGPSSQKWFYPTILAGVAVGAVAGPGMVAGAYAGGTIAQHFWPTKLPVTIALSMMGGILGDGLWKMLFPDNPPKELLADPQPGQYPADQNFYLETRCVPTEKVSYTEKPWRATYSYQGETRSALFKHYPGKTIELDANGRPVKEMRPKGPPPFRMREEGK